ncbi:MAG: molybdopterin-dependent oxidoreductase [Chloroflexota bacterium]
MKNIIFSLLVVVMLVACSPAAQPEQETATGASLLVTVGDQHQTFSVADLMALPSSQATFKDVAYKGVSIPALLESAGVNLDQVKALKGVATDGYTVNYDTNQVMKDNVLVAYALADGSPLSADDGNFRMVLPDEEGKLNLRMLAELQVVQ